LRLALPLTFRFLSPYRSWPGPKTPSLALFVAMSTCSPSRMSFFLCFFFLASVTHDRFPLGFRRLRLDPLLLRWSGTGRSLFNAGFLLLESSFAVQAYPLDFATAQLVFFASRLTVWLPCYPSGASFFVSFCFFLSKPDLTLWSFRVQGFLFRFSAIFFLEVTSSDPPKYSSVIFTAD